MYLKFFRFRFFIAPGESGAGSKCDAAQSQVRIAQTVDIVSSLLRNLITAAEISATGVDLPNDMDREPVTWLVVRSLLSGLYYHLLAW